MTRTHQPNLLEKQLIQMIALEAGIVKKIGELIPEVSDHSEATALLASFQTLSRRQQQALETRLHTIASNEPQMKDPVTDFGGSGLSERGNHPISTALQIIYTMVNQAVFGYAVLHALATRFLDSILIADQGTSYHLARQHTKNYIQAVQKISRLLHDVLLWELDQEGFECKCICPSCSVGICLCALAGRSFLSNTLSEAGPIAVDEGIYVQLPKQNSAARKAGLRRGDVILGANGEEFESWGDIQSAVRNAETGEEILLTVRRKSGELEETVLIHP